jgi:hypothetical protein
LAILNDRALIAMLARLPIRAEPPREAQAGVAGKAAQASLGG